MEKIICYSVALGRGWRIGFLGLLHMEVFIQRLEQEYGAQPIVTAPAVTYKAKIFGSKNITKYQGDIVTFNNPVHFPDPQIVSEFYEPMIIATIITPGIYNLTLKYSLIYSRLNLYIRREKLNTFTNTLIRDLTTFLIFIFII